MENLDIFSTGLMFMDARAIAVAPPIAPASSNASCNPDDRLSIVHNVKDSLNRGD